MSQPATAALTSQRLAGLAQANEIRCARARLKRSLKWEPMAASRRDVGLLILDPPEWLATMQVRQLIMAASTTGPTKADALMHAAGVHSRRTLGRLTRRQRVAMAALLGVREDPSRSAAVPVVVAVTDALAGVPSDGVAEWWRFRRRELGGLSPREAVLSDAGSVVRLAEMDAANLRRDEERSDG